MQNLQNYIMTRLNHVGGSSTSITQQERWDLLSKILVYEDLVHNL